MAFIVTESCIMCKYTDCVDVCPVDCFHEAENMLVINPIECIDCNLCVNECPVDAIFSEQDLPQGQKIFIEINKKLSKKYPVIYSKKDPLKTAEKYKYIKKKKNLL